MKKILLGILVGILVLVVGFYIAYSKAIHNEKVEYNEKTAYAEEYIEAFLDDIEVLQEGGTLEFEDFYRSSINAGKYAREWAYIYRDLSDMKRKLPVDDFQAIMVDIRVLIVELYCNAAEAYYFQGDRDSDALQKKIREDAETVRNMMAELCVPYDV